MNGIFYGVLVVANHTYMKGLMSFKRLIIFQTVTKSLEKTDFATIWLECKRDMENKTLILFQILTFYLMNLEISMLTIKN